MNTAEPIRESSVRLWMSAYSVTLRTDSSKRKRLIELQTWDNTNGNTYENRVKRQALIRLLNGK